MIYNVENKYVLIIYILNINQLYFTILTLSHPDNLIIINIIITPLHIIPEWYFLSFYSILKVIPNKNTGFIIIIIAAQLLIIIGEFKIQISEYKNYNNILIFYLFLIYLYLLWIGCQLPQDLFIYYGRIIVFLYLVIISMLVNIGVIIVILNIIKVIKIMY